MPLYARRPGQSRLASTRIRGTPIPRFHIHTLGCKVNQAESETIAAALLAHGWKQEAHAGDADVLVLNTCTVTGEADAKNRKAIRTLLRSGNAPLIVTGCAINLDAQLYANIDERITCEKDKTRIASLADTLMGNATQERANELEIADIRGGGSKSFRTRVDLKIQDGCNNACSYCIVHVARGAAKSVPAQSIVEQACRFAEQGTAELVLVGIDLAAYNDAGTNLAALVQMLQEQTNIGRVRISSVEPQSVTPSLIRALGQSDGRLCRHLHLCLQSGSTKVLREMNRNYTAPEFETLVAELRRAAPTLAFSTDVIVGFPGESEEDFAQTCTLVETCGFMRLHVFRYSKRPGTPAAQRADQIDPRVKAERSQTLIELGHRLALQDMERRIGTSERIVIERPGLGTSESYHAVACSPKLEAGSLVELTFTDIDTEHMRLQAH